MDEIAATREVSWRYSIKTTDNTSWTEWLSADSDPHDWLWHDNWTDMRVEETYHSKEEPYMWVYESPGYFDPRTGGEPPYTDFSDVEKPGYFPLYRHPRVASEPKGHSYDL